MMTILSLRYTPPRPTRATRWGEDWRKRWLKHVGSVHQHYQTGELIACYADEHDPTMRLALQAELEAKPHGVAQVLAAHRRVKRAWNAAVIGSAA